VARSVRMLPMARSSGSPAKFSITGKDWGAVEAAYGCVLPDGVRHSIVEATNHFLRNEVFERKATPARLAMDKISSIRTASNNLRHELARCGGEPGHVAQQFIKEQFSGSGLTWEPHERLFHALGAVLLSLSTACSQALTELGDQDARPFREGASWEHWIQRLTDTARDNKLPFRVSKGSDKSRRESPFTLLVAALQRRLPKEAQRHAHSHAALAKAISKARRQNGTNKVAKARRKVPPEVP
jgi:hypothetical protein